MQGNSGTIQPAHPAAARPTQASHALMMPVGDNFYLVEMFEHFTGELTRLKRQLEAINGQPEMTICPPSGDVVEFEELSSSNNVDAPEMYGQTELSPRLISARLCTLLQRYGTQMARTFGSFGATLFEEAQFAMAALADDLFIHEIRWNGQMEWRDNPIEAQLFGTSNAGNMVFERIDDLLAKRDPGKIEMANIYLYVLRLNFKGRYRGSDESDLLNRYRLRLHAFITNSKPKLADPSFRLFPDAYEATSDLPDPKGLPHAKRWLVALGGIMIGYLLVSHLIWTQNITTVLEIIDLTS